MCLTAIVVFPLLNALVKYLLTNDYSIVQIMWMRSIVHMSWMLALFLPYGGIRLLRSNRPGLQLVRSTLQLVALVLYIIALSHGAAHGGDDGLLHGAADGGGAFGADAGGAPWGPAAGPPWRWASPARP